MKVYKYGTGEEVPKGAIYLYTKEESNMIESGEHISFVWHYFLVEEGAES